MALITKTVKEMEKLGNAERRSAYINDIARLFEPSTDQRYGAAYESKGWTKEFENIHALLSSMNPDIHEELFLITCEKYLELRKTQPTADKALSAHEEFLKFIKIEEYEPYVAKIPQNIFKSEIYFIIDQCLNHDNLIQAESFLNIFLLPENKNLSNFRQYNTLYNILSNNKKNNLNFLLDNLDGWSNAEALNYIFSMSSLDDQLLDKLMNKTQGTDYSNNNILERFYSRDIPAVRKLQIINKLGVVNEPSFNMYAFYVKGFNEGTLNGNMLKTFNDPYLSNFHNLEFFQKWFKKSGYEVQTVLPTLFPLGFINQEILTNNILTCLSNPQAINMEQCDLINQVLNKLNIDHNSAPYQKVLLKLIDHNKNYHDNIYMGYFNGLNMDLHLKDELSEYPYENIKHFLKEKKSVIYDLLVFSKLPNKEKEKIYPTIINAINNIPNYSTNIIEDATIDSLYNFARNNTTNRDFFMDTFINTPCITNTLREVVFRKFFAKFKEDKEPLVFNLPEENPLVKFFRGNNAFTYGHGHIIQELTQYFHNDLNNTTSEDGMTVKEIAEKKGLASYVQGGKEFKKKTFFGFLGTNEEPVQVIRTPSGLEFITDPAKKVAIVSATEDIQSNEDKSFDGLVVQASKDLKNLQTLLDANADKPLHIEVKIRSETILLHNLNFLTNIKDTTEDIAFEDLYFLKNNLNKYLFQSLNTYIKSVTRYEVLSEPGNKLNTKSEEELEKQKEKIDNEALKQIGLLEKELDLVKEHVISQINRDLLTDMKVTTRVLQNRVEDSENRSEPESATVVRIRKP